MHYVEQLRCDNILSAALDFAALYAEIDRRGKHGTKWEMADLLLDGIRLLEMLLLWAGGHHGQVRENIEWMEEMRKAYAMRRALLLGREVRELDNFLPPEKVDAVCGDDPETKVYYYGLERRYR